MADLFNVISAAGNAVVAVSEHASAAASEHSGAAPDPGEIMQELIEHGWLRAKDLGIVAPPPAWPEIAEKGGKWLDLSITKMTLNMWIAGLLIFLLFRYLARRPITGKSNGGRFLNFLEPFVIYVRSEMVYQNMGEKLGRKFLPLFLTQFFFILFCNLLRDIQQYSVTKGGVDYKEIIF